MLKGKGDIVAVEQLLKVIVHNAAKLGMIASGPSRKASQSRPLRL